MDMQTSQFSASAAERSGEIDKALLTVLAAGTQGRVDALRVLLQRAGSASALLALGANAWRDAGLSASQIQALRCPDAQQMQRGIDWLQASNTRSLLHWAHPDYPPLLRQIASPPLALWIDGDASVLWRPSVAIVGSRAATATGCETAYQYAQALADTGLAIVSGLALGIDAAAHRGAMESAQGCTVAVIGTGPDVVYPSSHAKLQQRIAQHGAVVSEFWPGTPPLKQHFPRRNRILAGLCLGLVVVEAAERSGALITARLAAEAGREVLAVPGSIHNPQARGCLQLLRDGARMAASVDEVREVLAEQVLCHVRMVRENSAIEVDKPPVSASNTPAQANSANAANMRDEFDADICTQDLNYQRLWSALDFDPIGMDGLIARSGLTSAQVSAMLPLLELQGRVRVEFGRYARIA